MLIWNIKIHEFIISLCTTLHGRIKGKSRDTTEMYPGKVMHRLMDKPLIQRCCYSNPQYNVSYSQGFIYKVLPECSR